MTTVFQHTELTAAGLYPAITQQRKEHTMRNLPVHPSSITSLSRRTHKLIKDACRRKALMTVTHQSRMMCVIVPFSCLTDEMLAQLPPYVVHSPEFYTPEEK